jgi:hypothetical protein
MNRLYRYSLVAVCLGALSIPCTFAQDAPAAPPAAAPQHPRGPRPKPVNIKALPKDISGDDLMKLMHQYEGELGVECEYCHAKNPETKRNDFASDANPMKDKARVMIRMTEEINAKYLAELSDRKSAIPVTCGTCHRGMARPLAFVPPPSEHEHEHDHMAPAPAAPPAS